MHSSLTPETKFAQLNLEHLHTGKHVLEHVLKYVCGIQSSIATENLCFDVHVLASLDVKLCCLIKATSTFARFVLKAIYVNN